MRMSLNNRYVVKKIEQELNTSLPRRARLGVLGSINVICGGARGD
jgi:hypothetical protein